MKFFPVILFSLLTWSFAQDIPSTSSGELKFYVDHAAFKGKEKMTYQEFYLMIHADQLNFVGSKNNSDDTQKKNASFKVSSVIQDQNEQIVSDKQWFTDALLNRDSIDLKSLVVYDQWAELLGPGRYNVTINVVEQEYKVSGKSEFIINVPSFDEEIFSSSDFEFISKIEEKKGDSHFEKSGKIIIPNPWRRYGLLIPRLSFYYELYNIGSPGANEFLQIDYSIIDKDNIEVKSLSGVEVKKTGENISVVHAIDLTGLNSGIYTLTAHISDPESNQECSQTRPFEVIQIDYLTKNPLLTEEEAETGGKLLEYVATKKEFEIFQSLSLQGKTQFLINFWKEKDTSPGTPENEYLQSLMQRFVYANQHFGWGSKEGYKTDKGRILIKYGMPDEIERFHSEASTAPYEIWTYTEDRSFNFVFGDVNSNGNFVLLHSTKEGEVSNYAWKEYLKVF